MFEAPLAKSAPARPRPANQIEQQKTHRAHHPLEVIPEDPQVEHVSTQVHPAGVQEHRGEQRGPEGQRYQRRQIVPDGVFMRDHAPGLNKRLQRALWRL
jgi:hypothetical protein